MMWMEGVQCKVRMDHGVSCSWGILQIYLCILNPTDDLHNDGPSSILKYWHNECSWSHDYSHIEFGTSNGFNSDNDGLG